MKQDVAIIGAGVHGASAAIHLAERGARVVVLERGTPAGGPTGRSSAVVRGYYVNDFLARTTRESIELFQHFTDWTHGGRAGFRTTGALFLHGEEDGDRVHDTAARLNAIGTSTEVLGRERLAAEFAHFALDGLGWGVWERDAGYADPAGTTLGMLARAQRLGAEVRQGTRVMAVETDGTGVLLRTDAGDPIKADRLLVAAGPWTGPLLAGIGVRLPLRAERHIIATYGWGEAAPVPYVWASMPDGVYAKPDQRTGFLLGTLWPEDEADPDDFDEELAPAEALRVTEAAVARMPQLIDSAAAGGYTGLYDVAPDWQPLIGYVTENVAVVAGTAGHGFKWAPALGRHVADLLTGAPADPGLAQFAPDRFSRGALVDGGFGAAKIMG
ncbi:FAD-binding oxidoreductase [Spongiactinospora rosea]|uniref:FAD-binding oxidoreductase n=1 Tax=Spongiactinospora rosea TaxID=2248750 RepID=A0A366M192_9ACTN|nr:FAD-dependent oxidoreductase [Spongiactinospora rosea]RBQ19399.1 FAD-binding oxidoreductase [Spongiactinospora rosea]